MNHCLCVIFKDILFLYLIRTIYAETLLNFDLQNPKIQKSVSTCYLSWVMRDLNEALYFIEPVNEMIQHKAHI